MSKASKRRKGQSGSKIILVGKGGARSRCVGCTPSMEEATSYKNLERERKAHLSREIERDFWHTWELGKGGKSNPRLSLSWGKLHLEDLGTRWSVGEDGGEEAFSSSP